MKHVLLMEELPVKVMNQDGVEDWCVEIQVVYVGHDAALGGYGRAQASPVVLRYDQWLRMNPLVWKECLRRGVPAWGEAFYQCRTCQGWSIARPGCSACQDAGEVRASSTGDYPVFSFEASYEPIERGTGLT